MRPRADTAKVRSLRKKHPRRRETKPLLSRDFVYPDSAVTHESIHDATPSASVASGTRSTLTADESEQRSAPVQGSRGVSNPHGARACRGSALHRHRWDLVGQQRYDAIRTCSLCGTKQIKRRRSRGGHTVAVWVPYEPKEALS